MVTCQNLDLEQQRRKKCELLCILQTCKIYESDDLSTVDGLQSIPLNNEYWLVEVNKRSYNDLIYSVNIILYNIKNSI